MNVSLHKTTIWIVTIYILCSDTVSCSNNENAEIKDDSNSSPGNLEKDFGNMKISSGKPPLYGRRPLKVIPENNVDKKSAKNKEPLSESPTNTEKVSGSNKGKEITTRAIERINDILKKLSADRTKEQIILWEILVSHFPTTNPTQNFAELHTSHFLALQKKIQKDLGDKVVVMNQVEYDTKHKPETRINWVKPLTVLDEIEKTKTPKKRFGFPLRIIGKNEQNRYMKAIKMAFIPGPRPKSEEQPFGMYIGFLLPQLEDTYKLVAAVLYKINGGKVEWVDDFGGDISSFVVETIKGTDVLL